MENKIISTQDGSHTILSEQFGVTYHSKYGAIQETQHVFVDAAFKLKLLSQKKIAILDIGFGTGLNVLMTWLEAKNHSAEVDYVAIEAYPLSADQAAQLNYPDLLNLDEKDTYFFQQLHQSAWDEPTILAEQFTFTKCLKRFEEVDFEGLFDIVYFDAFAPNAQPELWETELLSKMYRALKPKGIFTTYCAKGAFKRNLKSVGFEVKKLKGPPGKREMTMGVKH